MATLRYTSAIRVVVAIMCLSPVAMSGEVAAWAEPVAPVVEAGPAEKISHWAERPDEWFSSPAGRQIVANVIARQTSDGGWPKNYDARQPPSGVTASPTTKPATATDGQAAKASSVAKPISVATIDNGATYSELRLLARASRVTANPAALDSFSRGLGFLVSMQYANGGFPQRFPLEQNYGRHITFNDDAMIGALRLLRDAAEGRDDFAILTPEQRQAAATAEARGRQCILDTQIRHNGTLTLWCQQHDEVTLAPAKARAYELPSIASSESAGILLYLMEVPRPDARTIQAVKAGVACLEKIKITGMEYRRVQGPQYERGSDRVLVPNPTSPPIWARFYDLESLAPLFSDRDSYRHDKLSEVSHERRMGYAWYSTAPNKVLAQYQAWLDRVGQR